MPRTWVDGVETPLTETEWARHSAAFLGCGFRVTVPPGAVRTPALAAAREQALDIAARFDAPFDEAPWRAAASVSDAIEIAGGWRHRFRGPAGTGTTRITVLQRPTRQWRRADGVRLPWAVNAHSPLTDLPVISRHEETLALGALGAVDALGALGTLAPGAVGLWWNTAERLASSTAGPLLLRVDAQWVRAPAGDGAVPHFLWSRVAELLEARERPLDDEVVAGAEGVHAIDPLGGVTTVDVAATPGRTADEPLAAELRDALETVLHHT